MTITGPVVPKFFSTTSSSANEPSIALDGSQFDEGEIFTDLQTGRMWMLGYSGSSVTFRPVLPFVRNNGSPSVVATQVVNDSGMMKVQNAQTSTAGAFNAFDKFNVTTAGATVTSGTYTSNVNEAQLHIVRKATAGTITKGQVVRVVGSTGSHLTVELADASVESTAKTTIGVAAETITNSADGYMMTSGELTGLSNVPSTSFADGDQLWLSETTGAFTKTRPTQPAHGVVVGWVISASNGSNARIFVKVDNGQELNEIHDVLITSVADKDLIQWDRDTSLWKNRSLANAGIAAASHTHTASQISDSTTAGRALLTGADAAAQRTSLGLGTAAQSATGDFAAASHTHTASAISDSTTAGRALLTAADASAQRTSLGLGTAATSATGDFAAASHTHSLSALTQSGATNGQVVAWNGSAWAATTASGSGTVTSVASGTGLSGGPITTTGTLTVDFATSGTSSSTQAVRADDTRLSNARTPSAHKSTHATGGTDALTASDIGAAATSHSHGNITSAGAIGSTSGLPIITTASGVLTAGSFGTTSGTFCEGSDSRIGKVTDANYGDITVSSTGTVWTINGGVHQYPKVAPIATIDYTSQLNTTTMATFALTASRYWMAPFVAPSDFTVANLRAYITTGVTGAQVYLAVYASSATSGYPTGAPLVSSGAIAAATTSAYATFATSLAMTENTQYWLMIGSMATLPTVRSGSVANAANLGCLLSGTANYNVITNTWTAGTFRNFTSSPVVAADVANATSVPLVAITI